MNTENIKKAVDFVNEVAKALEDKKVSTIEAFGLIPETVAFLSIFKDMTALGVEVEMIEDKMAALDPLAVRAWLDSEGIGTKNERVYATLQAVYWINQALKTKV